MKDTEYLKLRRQIKEDATKKLEALDMIWLLANPGQAIPKPLKPLIREDSKNGDTAGSAIVDQAVGEMPDEFTSKDVYEHILNAGGRIKRPTLSHALKRMDFIECVERGKGTRPSRYRKVKITATADQIDKIKKLGKQLNLDAEKFKNEVMIGRYKSSRLVDLTSTQAAEIIANMEAKSLEKTLIEAEF